MQTAPADHLLDGLGELAGVGEAVDGIARQRTQEDAAHVVGDAGVLVERLQVGVADADQHVELAAAGEERPPHDHLGEHDAEGEDVAPPVELAPHDLLGRHVPELAFELARLGAPLDLLRADDAEVGQLHRARAIDEHVARRDVAVHQVERLALLVLGGVRMLERASHGEDHLHAHVEGNGLVLRCRGANEPRAGGAVDVLHRHVHLVVLLAEVEDLDDVRMTEPRRHPRLVDEHGDEVRVAGELREDALDRDDLLEAMGARLPGEVHLGHAARRDALEQLVGTELHGRRLHRCGHRPGEATANRRP